MSEQKQGRHALALAGNVFGRLTVKERAGTDSHRRVMWRCACECGQETVVAGRHLVTGDTQSCGCLRKDLAPARAPAKGTRCVAGAKFGKLTLDKIVAQRSYSPVWRCVCECGGEKLATGSALRKGHAKSCGCLKAGRPKIKAVKVRTPKAVKSSAPKSTRMSVRPELRTPTKQKGNPVPHKPTAAQKSMHNKTMGGLTKKARPHTDLGPWTPTKGITHMTPPAQRDPRAVQLPAPKHNHRYGVDASEITPLFSAMRPGQYLEVAA